MRRKEEVLRFYLQNEQPIELVDFTNALVSMQSEYTKFAAERGVAKLDAKLYVEKVKEGSIIIDLAAHVSDDIFPAMAGTVTIVEFGKILKGAFDYFLRIGERPKQLSKSLCKAIKNIVNSTAKDRKASITVSIENSQAGRDIIVNINTEQANAVQNRANVEQERIEVQEEKYEEKDFNNVLLQITQLNANRSADKGKVEEIDRHRDYKLLLNDENKALFTEGEKNPLKQLYYVDIRPHRIEGKIKAYQVLRVHEAFEE